MIDHFGILAPFYERFIPPRISPELLERIGPQNSGVLLDAGGGTGRVARLLIDRAGTIVLADESGRMLREASKKHGLRGVCSLTENLPFSANTFDYVIMVDALHHVGDQRATCTELWRLLRPGGRIVIEEPDIDTIGVRLLALAEKAALMRSRFLSGPEIVNCFSFPAAQIKVLRRESTLWVVVEKEK